MHSTIYQLTPTRLAANEQPKATAIQEGDDFSFDYVEIAYNRKERIRQLAKSKVFDKLFIYNDDKESLTYLGGIEDVADCVATKMRTLAVSLRASDFLGEMTRERPLSDMRRLMNDPLDLNVRFLLSDDKKDVYSVGSDELMCELNRLQVGDTLYFGAVFDYHY